MKIDASKSAIENIVALVNATNAGANLTSAAVTLGAATAASGTGGRNTTVQATAVAGQGFKGNVTVSYIRRGLGDSVLTPDFTLDVDDGVTKADIIAGVATKLGLVVAELDLTGDITRPASGLTSTVTLESIAGSYLYVDGSTQAITLNWADHSVDLATAVATTDLTGFDAAS